MVCVCIFFKQYTDRTIPMDKHMEAMSELEEITTAPATPQMFGNAGREHMRKYGMWLCVWWVILLEVILW